MVALALVWRQVRLFKLKSKARIPTPTLAPTGPLPFRSPIISISTRNVSSSSSPSNMPTNPTTTTKLFLRFAKLTTNATTPTRGTPTAAGYDLFSAYNYTIAPMGKELVMTDIQIAIPDGHYGRVAPRSGLAHKNFIDVGAGVVDQDYRGNVGVILFNFGKTEFNVTKGDRVAQLICEKISYPDLHECQTLDETTRGENGFGSSGIR